MYNTLLIQYQEDIRRLGTMKERLLFVADLISKHNMDDNNKWINEGANSTPDMYVPFSKLAEYKFVEKTLRDKANAEDFYLLDKTVNGYSTICNNIVTSCYELGNLKVV